MKKTAFIFPGQGSQFTGMGKDFYENFSSSSEVFELANKVLNKDIKKICFEGLDEELKKTINTQSAILTMSIAALKALEEKTGINADYTAGHSLGEYCALYCAGVLSLEDAFRAIQKRSELMSKVQGGAMSAVLGLDEATVCDRVKEAQNFGMVTIANYNEPKQIVITGEVKAVEKANELLSKAGAKRVIPLAVSGPFHSPLMKDAGVEFGEFLNSIIFSDAKIPVVTNIDAQITTEEKLFREKMPKQIYSSVYWTQTIYKMIENGVDTFIEIGPGRVLAGLNRKISSDVKTLNVYDIESLNKTIEELSAIGV